MTLTGRSRILLFLYIFISLVAGIGYAETSANVATNDANEVTSTSVVLRGTITPAGSIFGAWFEYGTTNSLGTRTDVQTFAATTSTVNLTQSLRNLQPRTTYYFRAVGYRSGA